MAESAALTLTGGRCLAPDGLRDGDLTIVDGRIADGAALRRLDASGTLILPGIVDAHGDGFERHLAPRRGAMTDLGAGLIAVENELAANGITTALLAQFWSWEGGMRRPPFAEKLADALSVHPARLDLRLQLRFEYPMLDDFDAVVDFVDRHGIGYLVFNDHLPHEYLAAGKRVPRLEGQALKSRRSPADHLALMQRLHDAMDRVWAALPGLTETLLARGVLLGSHDDETCDGRARWRGLGVPIAEFPTSFDAARAAADAGDPVILGAPNVVRGGSHKTGGMAAGALLADGIGDALASDYHYPSPLAAIRRLIADGWSLPRAWRLVSEGPARVLGLGDRGALHAGQRADVILTDPGLSRVLAVFAEGVPIHVVDGLAARWMLR